MCTTSRSPWAWFTDHLLATSCLSHNQTREASSQECCFLLSTVSTLTNRHQWSGTLKKVGVGSKGGGRMFYFLRILHWWDKNQLKPKFKKRKNTDVRLCCENVCRIPGVWVIAMRTLSGNYFAHLHPSFSAECYWHLLPMAFPCGPWKYHMYSLWLSRAGRMRPDDPGGKDLNLEEVLIGLELGDIITLHGHPSKYPYSYCHRCNS